MITWWGSDMVLHTISAGPASQGLSECLVLAGPDDALRLLGDGVYSALSGSHSAEALEASGVSLYALGQDVLAAGVSASLLASVTVIDFDAFVALTEAFSQQLNWP